MTALKKSTGLFALLAVAAFSIGAPPGVLRTSVTLTWDAYPTNQISPELVLKLYSSTDLGMPMTNWTVIATIAPTNTTITLPMNAQQRWFTMTASNYWGESFFSNVVGVPWPPRNDLNLRIGP